MDYSELCADPHLRDLPFKIELNEYGTIMMTPASNRHALLQGEIAGLIREIMKVGRAPTECSIETSKGVKVADVAWVSPDFLAEHGGATPFPVAPEVCVEIVSPSNSQEEMRQKVDLYLAKGAKEVWICSEDGSVSFRSYEGEIPGSKVIPGMPPKVEVP